MRTFDYPYNSEHLAQAWSQFRYGDATAVHSEEIDPVILASWQRCAAIFSQATLHTMRYSPRLNRQWMLNQHPELISTAVPYLEDIHQFIAGAASAVILTDEEGVILAIEGNKTSINTMHKIGLGIGQRWSEDSIGTNAIGLSLITAMPTQVVGAEHYLRILHDYGDSAAPIHDENGTIIGTVAILTFAERTNESQLALVMATARAITNQLQSSLILEQANLRLRQLDAILESVADGVMTWNTNGQIEHVNSMVCQIIGVRGSYLLGKSQKELMLFPLHIQAAIDERRELSDIEARIQVGERIVQCLVSIRMMKEGPNQVIGGLAMMRPLSQVRSLVNQQTSALPSVTFDDFMYESSEMHAVLRQAQTAAKGSAGVLLIGEGGVGKTVLAQAIHNASPRANKPFVVVNCGMIPAEFMVEELLGIEVHDDQPGRPSKFELADGGTLLIDMIDRLSLEAQQILLNVVNSRHVNRLHATRPTVVNVRIIATTAQDIEGLIQTNSFLPQLYYLFSAFRLYIPPLRERRKDAVRLAQRILDRASTELITYSMEAAVIELLQSYPWPGNVRELESVIERAVIHASGSQIGVNDLPENIRTEHSLSPGTPVPRPVISLVEAERDAIMRAGWASRGAISDMAAMLGVNRSTLWRKLKEHRLSAKDFKDTPKDHLRS